MINKLSKNAVKRVKENNEIKIGHNISARARMSVQRMAEIGR